MDDNWIFKKLFFYILIGMACTMIIFPIVTNYLMFFNIFPVAEDEKTWIGYLGSFWGAIIGGVISGAITLIGVRMTIQNQKNEEFIRIYPQMMLLGDGITDSLKHFLEEINEVGQNTFDIVHIVRKYKSLSDEHLRNSTKINGFVYENYKHIHGHFYYFDKYIKDNSTHDEYGVPVYNLDPAKIEHFKRLIRNGLEEHDKLTLNISNTFFTLTVVDRVPKKYKKLTRKTLKKVIKKEDY